MLEKQRYERKNLEGRECTPGRWRFSILALFRGTASYHGGYLVRERRHKWKYERWEEGSPRFSLKLARRPSSAAYTSSPPNPPRHPSSSRTSSSPYPFVPPVLTLCWLPSAKRRVQRDGRRDWMRWNEISVVGHREGVLLRSHQMQPTYGKYIKSQRCIRVWGMSGLLGNMVEDKKNPPMLEPGTLWRCIKGLDWIITNYELQRKKSLCRSLVKSLEPFIKDPSNRRPKARFIYGLHAYELQDLAVLHLPELIVIG